MRGALSLTCSFFGCGSLPRLYSIRVRHLWAFFFPLACGRRSASQGGAFRPSESKPVSRPKMGHRKCMPEPAGKAGSGNKARTAPAANQSISLVYVCDTYSLYFSRNRVQMILARAGRGGRACLVSCVWLGRWAASKARLTEVAYDGIASPASEGGRPGTFFLFFSFSFCYKSFCFKGNEADRRAATDTNRPRYPCLAN